MNMRIVFRIPRIRASTYAFFVLVNIIGMFMGQPSFAKGHVVAKAPETAKVTPADDINDADLDFGNVSETPDPLEPFNRAMFSFNDKIDMYFLKPIAILYDKIIPKPLNRGIHNAITNLNDFTTFANDLLQLHFGQALNEFWRITINTTVGIGGLFDVGGQIGLPVYENNFGLTMARWGWRNSTYVVLPFWGSKTIRDTAGMPVDWFYLSIYPYIHPRSVRWGVYAIYVVDNRVQLLNVEPLVEEVSLDKYIFVRSAYMQNRNTQIEENLALGFTGRHNADMHNADFNDSSSGYIDVTA